MQSYRQNKCNMHERCFSWIWFCAQLKTLHQCLESPNRYRNRKTHSKENPKTIHFDKRKSQFDHVAEYLMPIECVLFQEWRVTKVTKKVHLYTVELCDTLYICSMWALQWKFVIQHQPFRMSCFLHHFIVFFWQILFTFH